MLSWTYFGVNTSIEGTGGQSCVNYITTKRRLLESACVCIIFMYTLHRSYFKLNFDNPRHPIVQTKFRQILLLLHTFVFGIEIGFKLATSTLIWVLNPCHILTILQILLLASSRPSLRTVIFRIHVHMMNGPLLALTFPVLNTRFLPFERVTYFVQHFLIILIPTTFLNQNSEFSVEPIDDFSWVTFSLSIQVLYHFLILQPIALITGINLNNILCPAISDPFPGPNYRLWAVFHQSATGEYLNPDHQIYQAAKWFLRAMAPLTTTVDQYKLSSLPTDGVTSVRFQPGKAAPQFLVASSWDCTVRIYDVASGSQRLYYQHSTPVLDTTFSDTVHVVSGSIDGELKLFDCNTNQNQILGSCLRAISTMHYNSNIQACITGSWDCTVRIWDPRASVSSNATDSKGGAQSVHRQPNTVYTMDSIRNQLVVGTAGRHVLIWDLRQMHAPVEQRESSLRYQTRCIQCFPNGQGYILGSIEGRIAVEMFDPNPEVQKKKYAFKCHRVKDGDKETIYPVIAIAFHQGYNTFATVEKSVFSTKDRVYYTAVRFVLTI
ncbi:Mitotic checkpoint protein isoform 2 [Schistosoma japonicum]|uniref:Mitotic checkpoint protein isoform 2 n=1 Tax=Schistosoma japonicum TaxID=6182 RepID=A0A4Z2DTF2_SCHJA|nr:Mitotic checkpoint protein isoform 2 [Schistosoma japonicum]